MRQILQTPDEMRIVNPYRYGGGGGSPYAALLAAIDASSPTLEYGPLREFLAGNYADTDAVPSATEWVSGTYPATQDTASAQPTFIESANGGHPAFRFDGNDWLQATGFTFSQPNTVLAVAQSTLVNSIRVISGTTSATGRHNLYINSSKWNISAGTALSTVGLADTNAHLFVATFNGASSSLHIDGSPVISGDAGTESMANLVIGNSATLYTYYFAGDIQIGPIIWDTPPTSGQIDAILEELEALGYVTLP